MKTWMTPPEVAKALRVKPQTVHAWIRSGELTAINVANHGASRPRYRISPEAFAEFELKRSVIPPPKPPVKRRKFTMPDGSEPIQYF